MGTYNYIEGLSKSIVDKANTDFNQAWVSLKVVEEIFKAQDQVELMLKQLKFPKQTVRYPEKHSRCGIVWPKQ